MVHSRKKSLLFLVRNQINVIKMLPGNPKTGCLLLRLPVCEFGSIWNLFSDAPWFLSENGRDFAGCGVNASSPCRTLNFLMGQFEEKLQPLQKSSTLNVLTDKDLFLDDHLFVSTLSSVVLSFQRVHCHNFPLGSFSKQSVTLKMQT